MRLGIYTATMEPIGLGTPEHIQGWSRQSVTKPYLNIRRNAVVNLGVVGGYQELYQRPEDDDVLAYFHDDLLCKEVGWDERVIAEFEDPKVGIVGFGGATRHGSPDLYKVPYRLQDLARFGYMSNVDDAEVHGERMEGSCDVAVLDGFALCVRRSLLDRCQGWTSIIGHADFFGYDYSVCAIARRLGYRIRMVGVRCHHLGGRTSVGKEKELKEITGQDAYEKAHRWFYGEFRDVMPYEVTHVRS